MLYKLELASEIQQQLSSQTDPKQILNKGKVPYISIASVINRLNLAFGQDWDWVDLKFWTTGDKTLQGDKVVHCQGTLIARLYDEKGNVHIIMKTGVGGHAVRNGYEEAYKSASSYALRKAAQLLGIGLDLSMKEEERMFNLQANLMEVQRVAAKEAVENTIWTDDMKKQHADLWKIIDDRMKCYNATPENLDQMVAKWSNNYYCSIYALDVNNMTAFCKWFSEQCPVAQEIPQATPAQEFKVPQPPTQIPVLNKEAV